MDNHMHADHFIDQLRLMGGLPDGLTTDRTLEAFRAIPREAFAGPGPWKVRSALAQNGFEAHLTPDADPRWLYHAVLVVLDEARGINIGEPTLWARLLARTDIRPGARVLQVGAGVGYYTAILAHLVGAEGRVVAYEVEGTLAERAKTNLTAWTNAQVRHGNAVTDLPNDDEHGPFDLVVAFAGVTHVPDTWSSHLSEEARLLLPLTGENGWGAMILAHRTNEGFEAATLGRCGFYPCAGARNHALAKQVSDLFSDPTHLAGWRFRMIHNDKRIRLEPVDG
ncbi:methyltransferase domain-containing protein [uncultured Tateyamaria sp.]|uniref:protein-L-isoaspartate O-methyltransferase family protein n=1 Tax=uncultured Tateyamaria sp. TaxID=455651 RepID=UPI00261983F9|nr:methyltransferase domain-containing protein [uncultured Tateyamaria sp.]